MKKTKWIAAFVSFLLVTVLCSELYQAYLRSFMGEFYYIGIGKNFDREAVCASVEEAAKANGIAVFAYERTDLDAGRSSLTIYATDAMRASLSEQYGVREGEIKSFLSGSTTVAFLELSEIPQDSELENYYFTGSMEEVLAAKAQINEAFPSSYVHREEITELHGIPIAVFCIFSLLLLVFTWIDIQFERKKNFIMLSMGQSCARILLCNIGADTAVFSLIFFGVRILCGRFFYIGYEQDSLLLGFAAFLVLNALLYLSILKLNYKEVLYGANINGKLLSTCYVIKALSLMVTIVCISVNIGVLSANGRYLGMYDAIDQYAGYSFVRYGVDTSEADGFMEEIRMASRVKSDLILDYMRQGKVALATGTYYVEDEQPVIHVNENTYGIAAIQSAVENAPDADFYLFLPEKYEGDPEFAGREEEIALSALDCSSENIRIASMYYKEDVSLVWFDYQQGVSEDAGFDEAKNPILLYWNRIPEEDVYFGCFSVIDQNIMFRMTDEEYLSLEEKYENLRPISKTGVVQRCGQYRAAFSRVTVLSCVISLLMLLWEVQNLYMIVRLEYQINAKTLAVKKILGYGLLAKSKAVLLVNLYAALISVLTVCGLWLMFGISGWYTVVISTVVLLGIEAAFLFLFIDRTEKGSVPKILKGGSL